MEIEFNGRWSDREKELWFNTNWKARNYEFLPVENDFIEHIATFQSENGSEKKKLVFQKVIPANPVFSPKYEAVITPELDTYMKAHHFLSGMYGEEDYNGYMIMNLFVTQQIYDRNFD